MEEVKRHKAERQKTERQSGREGRRVSLGELLRDSARRFGARPFLTMVSSGADNPADSGETLSFAQLNTLVNRAAHGLCALEAARGEYVATMLGNDIPFVACSYALKKIGAVEVAVNTNMRGRALARMLTLTNCRLLITANAFVPALTAILPQLRGLSTVVITDDADAARRAFADKTVLTYAQMLSDNTAEPAAAAAPVRDDETALVLFTSGTTGVSKGCALSHRACVRAAESMIEAFALSEQDCVYTPYPFFHVGAYQYDVLPALLVGGRVIMRDGFSTRAFWPQVARFGVTWFMSLGSVQSLLWAAPPCAAEKLHCLRFFWGTPLPVPPEAFERRFKVRVVRGGGYGSTDAGAVALPMWDKPGGGRVLPRYEVAIVDSYDNPLPPGETGELVLRPREPSIMMSEYVGMPQKTVAAWRNLWFHTGDLAFLDADGDLHWVARMTERIRVKGEMVSAYEIEEVVLLHAAVEDCAALGAPDEKFGEEQVKVFVTLKPGQQLTLEELREFCRPRMSVFMLPSLLRVLPQMPRTPTGKAAKAELKKMP